MGGWLVIKRNYPKKILNNQWVDMKEQNGGKRGYGDERKIQRR